MVEDFSITQTRDLRVELLEPDRERQAGRAGADGDDVVLHDVAFDVASVRVRRSCGGSAGGWLAAADCRGFAPGAANRAAHGSCPTASRLRDGLRRSPCPMRSSRSIRTGWAARGRRAVRGAARRRSPWEVHRIRLFGREVDSPRLSCWIGDPDAGYTLFRHALRAAALAAGAAAGARAAGARAGRRLQQRAGQPATATAATAWAGTATTRPNSGRSR